MMQSLEDLLRNAMALPPSERAALAGALIGSLDDGAVDESDEETVESLWSAEIAQRIAAIDAGRVQLVPWADVRQRMSDE